MRHRNGPDGTAAVQFWTSSTSLPPGVDRHRKTKARPRAAMCATSHYRRLPRPLWALTVVWRRECPPRHVQVRNNFNYLNPKRPSCPHFRPHRMHVLAAAKSLRQSPHTGERQRTSTARKTAGIQYFPASATTSSARLARHIGCWEASRSEPNTWSAVALRRSGLFELSTCLAGRHLKRPPALSDGWPGVSISFLGT